MRERLPCEIPQAPFDAEPQATTGVPSMVQNFLDLIFPFRIFTEVIEDLGSTTRE
jgi:hypothetical protein